MAVKAPDPQDTLMECVAIAAREVKRLAGKTELSGWDGADLERYAGICLRADNHRLTWLAKMDPTRMNDELLQRVLEQQEGEPGERPKRKPRAGA